MLKMLRILFTRTHAQFRRFLYYFEVAFRFCSSRLVHFTSSLINILLNFQLDARSCLTCDKVLTELEKIDDDTDSFGVDFVKINDKRLAKQYGIKTFPALTYFR